MTRQANVAQNTELSLKRYNAQLERQAALAAKNATLMGQFKQHWFQMGMMGTLLSGSYLMIMGKIIDNTARATGTHNLWVKAIAAGKPSIDEATNSVKEWDSWLTKITKNTTASSYQVKGLLARMYLIMSGVGMGREKAERYAKDLTKLALDVGSLFDIS